MSFTLIANTGAGDTIDSVTTSSINTTGANLIVVNTAWYNGVGDPTLSDSKINSWTGLTGRLSGANESQRLFYCFNPTVGSGHTFTLAGSTTAPAIGVSAWSGAGTSPFDQQNGATNLGASTLSTGSVTPGQDNELVISGICVTNNGGGAVSINGGFTITNTVAFSSGNHEGVSMAYLIQTTATAANPQWNATNSADSLTASIATFKAVAASSSIKTVNGLVYASIKTVDNLAIASIKTINGLA